MFVDDEGALFNPFRIGPESSNIRFAYKQPTSSTYPEPVFTTRPQARGKERGDDIPRAPSFPPPVYATWPPPKKHGNRSVSQDTLIRGASADGVSMKSQKGGISVSAAINKDMSAAKQLKGNEERIIAGGKSKSSLPGSGDGEKTLTTLMPVRKRSPSKSSGISVASKTGSTKSVHSHLSASQTKGKKAADAVERTDSNITLKQLKGSTNISQDSNASDKVSRTSQRKDAGAHEMTDRVSMGSKASVQQADNISHASFKSKASVQQADNISHASFKSKASVQQADNISHASFKSKASVQQADNISHVSFKSKASVQQADNISRISVKSKASVNQADNISRVSLKIKASAQQADNISHASIKSKASAQQADKISRISVKSKASVNQNDNVSQVEGSKAGDIELYAKGISKPSLKQVSEMVKSELQQSMETTKSLAEKAALISDRLKAGNEMKHNRFHSLIRMYTNTEPFKRCREDRMSFWFKDSVLS